MMSVCDEVNSGRDVNWSVVDSHKADRCISKGAVGREGRIKDANM